MTRCMERGEVQGVVQGDGVGTRRWREEELGGGDARRRCREEVRGGGTAVFSPDVTSEWRTSVARRAQQGLAGCSSFPSSAAAAAASFVPVAMQLIN